MSQSSAGGFQGTATAQLLASLSGQPQLQATIASQITPAISGALDQGAQIAGHVGPAIDLITTVAKGQPPTGMQAVAAMAGVAGMVNPIAGVAILAAGTLMQGLTDGINDLFKSLGLQHHAEIGNALVGGIRVGIDNPPPAPDVGAGKYDPKWRRWDSFTKLVTNASLSRAPHPLWFEDQVTQGYAGVPSPAFQAPMMRLIAAMTPSLGSVHPFYPETIPRLPTPKDDFEKFLYPIIKADLEMFFNGNPFKDPRALANKAVELWNEHHASAGPGRDAVYMREEDRSRSLWGYIQSGETELSGQRNSGPYQVTVNMGPILADEAPPPASNVVPIRPVIDIGQALSAGAAAADAYIGSAAGRAAQAAAIARLKKVARAPAPTPHKSIGFTLMAFAALLAAGVALARRR